jgi:hypothetical protein
MMHACSSRSSIIVKQMLDKFLPKMQQKRNSCNNLTMKNVVPPYGRVP